MKLSTTRGTKIKAASTIVPAAIKIKESNYQNRGNLMVCIQNTLKKISPSMTKATRPPKKRTIGFDKTFLSLLSDTRSWNGLSTWLFCGKSFIRCWELNPNLSLDRYGAEPYGEDNFLSSFIFLLASCFSFVPDVARYAFEQTKTICSTIK